MTDAAQGVLELPLAPTGPSPGRSPLPGDERPRPATLQIGGRDTAPTVVFDTYWRFAAKRQAMYDARLAGAPAPWTEDPILRTHRFTNCFRAADRVSQFLIRDVCYSGDQSPEEVVFRTMLFKLFNKIDTWRLLEQHLGCLSWANFAFSRYDQVLTEAFAAGQRLYSAAYVIPPPQLGQRRKHSNHLRLLELMMRQGLTERVLTAGSLCGVFELLRTFPSMGRFLAFQLAIDLNYSAPLHHGEDEFVVAGPGAKDGIRKCFGPSADGIEHDVIRYMAEHQDEHFARLGLRFSGLAGRRPLQLIDCQNLFCEVDKYARVAHPGVRGLSGRRRIKQQYRRDTEPLPSAWFPPKWGLNTGATVQPVPRMPGQDAP